MAFFTKSTLSGRVGEREFQKAWLFLLQLFLLPTKSMAFLTGLFLLGFSYCYSLNSQAI